MVSKCLMLCEHFQWRFFPVWSNRPLLPTLRGCRQFQGRQFWGSHSCRYLNKIRIKLRLCLRSCRVTCGFLPCNCCGWRSGADLKVQYNHCFNRNISIRQKLKWIYIHLYNLNLVNNEYIYVVQALFTKNSRLDGFNQRQCWSPSTP